MSEFTHHSELRVEKLTAYMRGLMNQENGSELLEQYNILSTKFTPADFLLLFDRLFDGNVDMDQLKSASNKLFNILYKSLLEYPAIEAPTDSFIDCLIRNNEGVVRYLNQTKTYIKQINREVNPELVSSLKIRFEELQQFLSHYVIKENILFPLMEKKWANSSCLKLMWSFHDDIRQNIKRTLEILNLDSFDLVQFNKISSLVYFNINTIIFREEHVLFPVMLETFNSIDFDDMLQQALEIGFHFVKIDQQILKKKTSSLSDQHINFTTGTLSIEQAELIFNHLTVDVTFVDECDTVKFFSNPKHRIFPRTTGIIGRKVQNCHPHESVDVVNRIVQSFKDGKKEVASFWIHMGAKYVLIQYYAVRNSEGNYKGILEVSQEISELQKITGENRLLDWEE
ncbi:MAG: DUF438 domain-containing protein [Prolixibacteraceae bacterium]